MTLQPQHEQAVGFGPSAYRDPGSDFDDPPLKRQRMSIDLARRTTYEHGQRLPQRSYMQQRDPYTIFPPRDLSAANRGSYYVQGQQSASAPAAEYSFGHQRTNSSSTSSPFLSPRSEYPAYQFSAVPTSMYQQQARDTGYQYSQNQYGGNQSRPIPQLAQSSMSFRQLPSSVPSQMDQSRPYPRPFDPEEQPLVSDRGYDPSPLASRPVHQSAQPLSVYDRPSQPLARTLPPPSQAVAGLLPPLQSLPSTQPRRDVLQPYSGSGTSSAETNPQLQSSLQSGSDIQNYMPQHYRSRDNG